jgi:hypothetical protein
VLQQIGTQVAEQLERQVTNQQLWLGRRVKIVDGTCLSMPDTAANQLQWPQNSNQKPGCGFPQLKVVGLFCLQSGALLEVAHDDKHHVPRHGFSWERGMFSGAFFRGNWRVNYGVI